ncbi:MAG: hypothetical protein ABSD46_03665 [Bacteroidota bacterium]
MVNLLDYKKNRYSQAGQDGIIEHIFNVLGIEKGNFVEFGAWDGIYLSNCRKLFDEGWSGVFIEADKKKFLELQKNYNAIDRITCINKSVEINGSNCFDRIMTNYAKNKPITFLSIDVDGIDLEIFESIEEYLPMVVCLEGGTVAHPLDPRMPIHCIYAIGQSLNVIKQVGEKKGYEVLCSFQDTFLIKRDLLSNFNPPSDLFQLYINGYRAYGYSHIPMYVARLKRFHRKNRILDYILKETKYYSKYQILKENDYAEWAKEYEQKISDILMALPDHLFEAPPKVYGSLINFFNLRSRIAIHRYSNNPFWKFVFYLRDSLKRGFLSRTFNF